MGRHPPDFECVLPHRRALDLASVLIGAVVLCAWTCWTWAWLNADAPGSGLPLRVLPLIMLILGVLILFMLILFTLLMAGSLPTVVGRMPAIVGALRWLEPFGLGRSWWLRQHRGLWSWGPLQGGGRDAEPRCGTLTVAFDLGGWLVLRASSGAWRCDWMLIAPSDLPGQGRSLRAALHHP